MRPRAPEYSAGPEGNARGGATDLGDADQAEEGEALTTMIT
ncbi:hypothetical protein [Roseivivax lentus]|nr:hypothetical protein [Roseivivax lentus]